MTLDKRTTFAFLSIYRFLCFLKQKVKWQCCIEFRSDISPVSYQAIKAKDCKEMSERPRQLK